MDALLRELKRDAMMSRVMPGIRFFRPLPVFFKTLKAFRVGFIDAGCGTGELRQEAMANDVHMIGIDLAVRYGFEDNVIIADATTFQYFPQLWPVICRPCHDEFAGDVIDRAFECGASALYVGFGENLLHDIGEDLHKQRQLLARNVGVEKENVWIFRRQK